MRPVATFVGTVAENAKVIEPAGGKKPFVGVVLESQNEYSKFPTKVKVVYYSKDNHGAAAQWIKGTLMFVQGEVSAEGYLGKDGKTYGSLKMFAKVIEIIQPPAATPPQARAVAPAGRTAQVADAQPVDDVPF